LGKKFYPYHLLLWLIRRLVPVKISFLPSFIARWFCLVWLQSNWWNGDAFSLELFTVCHPLNDVFCWRQIDATNRFRSILK